MGQARSWGNDGRCVCDGPRGQRSIGPGTRGPASLHGTLTTPRPLHAQVVAPYDSEDARGLLKAAIRDPDPVVVLENEILYGEAFPMDEAALDKDFTVPIGKAKVMRAGTDVTLVAFGKMVGYNLKAAELLEQEGISCEVINLRSLKPLDRGTLAASIRKTHRLVAVEEGWPQCGVASGVRANRVCGAGRLLVTGCMSGLAVGWAKRLQAGTWAARAAAPSTLLKPAPSPHCGPQRLRPWLWRTALTTWMRPPSG